MNIKSKYMQSVLAMSMIVMTMLYSFSGTALADGTETLGLPSIPIVEGNAIIANGVGLSLAQPGDINITVPNDVTISQVLLYWLGHSPTFTPDDTIEANGITITGTPIGNDDTGRDTAYRADITTSGLVSNGANTVAVGGLDFGVDGVLHGAGIMVIVKDASGSTIELRDGDDYAFFQRPAPRDTTVEQTFLFPASTSERTATLTLFAAGVSGTASSGSSGIFRPTAIAITVDGITTKRNNLLNSNDGEEWDTVVLNDVIIPAGVTELTVQLLSEDNGAPIPEGTLGIAASFHWITAGLQVPPPATAALGDRVWEDLNKNGIQDCIDGGATGGQADGIIGNVGDAGPECNAGIPGIKVNLGIPINGQCEPIAVDSDTTDASGFYGFDNLTPGDYCVVFDKSTIAPGFCTSAIGSIDLGDPQFTLKNAGAIDVDSDVNPDGVTGSVTLAPGDVNLTVDAGVFCPAKLGDRVWLDDGNGLQDSSENGVPGVTVKLLDCGAQQDGLPPTNATVLRTTTTEGPDGMYMFGGPGRDPLDPGNYAVEFVNPDSNSFNFTQQDANNNNSDDIDSDANPGNGRTICMPLASREYNPTKDGGLVPKGCDIKVNKTCLVPPPPPVSFDKCKGKLQQFTVIWNGSDPITVNGLGQTNLAVKVGDEVTFAGPFSQNDVKIQLSGAANGESVFHMSCSDEDFNDPSDCGKAAGDGKGSSGFINEWALEGFVDAEGRVLDCTTDTAGNGADSCTINLADAPSCETLGKPSSLTFTYTGDGAVSGCTDNAASRANKKPPTCSGNLPAGATVSVSVNKGSVSPSTVAPGEEFTITGFGSGTEVTLTGGGGTELDSFHTSCSAPLEAGDIFGNMQLVAFNGQRSSVNVTYNYEVTNIGDNGIVDILVNDDPLGNVGSLVGPLVPGDSVTFSKTVPIDATVTNIATVTADTKAGGMCAATDSVTVTVAGPPPCDVTGENRLKELKEDKIKWKLTNNGTKAAIIKSVTVTFPLENGQVKKLKLEGDIFDGKAGSNGSATLDAGDFNKGGLKERTLKAGDDKELEIQFTSKYKNRVESDYTILVEFEEGCSVTFKK